MSRDYRHGQKSQQKQSHKRQEEQRFVKVPTKQQREQQLRHAVRRQDSEAFEDYDEWEP